MNWMRLGVLKTAVALALFLGLSGFPGVSIAEKRVKFRMDWKLSATHSPYLIADQKGLYKAEGLSVRVIGGSGSTVSLKQLGGGAVEFALVDAPVLVQGRVKGVPARAIAVYYQRTPHTIMWNAKKHTIRNPKDLIGLKVGVKKQSSTFQGFRVFTRAQGIDMQKQITMVPIGFGVAPLLAGQVDAMVGFTMNEPLTAEDKGIQVGEMLFADYGVKMYGLTISTREDLLKSDPATVRAFLKASLKGLEYGAAHPDDVVAAIRKVVPQANPNRERRLWDKIVKTVLYPKGSEKRVGLQTESGWTETQDILFGLKLIEEKVPVGTIFTNAYQR